MNIRFIQIKNKDEHVIWLLFVKRMRACSHVLVTLIELVIDKIWFQSRYWKIALMQKLCSIIYSENIVWPTQKPLWCGHVVAHHPHFGYVDIGDDLSNPSPTSMFQPNYILYAKCELWIYGASKCMMARDALRRYSSANSVACKCDFISNIKWCNSWFIIIHILMCSFVWSLGLWNKFCILCCLGYYM